MKKIFIKIWHVLSVIIALMTIWFALMAIVKPERIGIGIEFVREKILIWWWKNYLLVLWLWFLESIPFVNIAIPGQTIMVIISWFLAQTNLILTIFCVIISSILWDLLAYYIGKHNGEFLLEEYGQLFGLTKERVAKLKHAMTDHAHRVIFASKWNSYTRWMLSFIAWMAHVKLWEFMIYNILGSVVYSTIIVYLARMFIWNYEKVVPYLRWIWLIIIGWAVLRYIFKKYYNARKSR